MKTKLLIIALISFLIFKYNPIQSQAIVANHASTNLDEVPLSYILEAKSSFRIWYGHTSHGSQITSGIQNLETHIGAPYTFSSSGSGGDLSYQELGGYDLGHNGNLYWETLTRQQLNDPLNDRNVIMWSWCGGVSDNTVAGINIYLNAMNQLELDFPEVTFIYMTGHLDIWSDSNLKARNQQIRDYCLANNKILFDFADIESYSPDGTFYPYANDNCDYYQGPGWGLLGNWADEFCDENPGSDFCWSCSCAHSKAANCNMKGQAFWWMLARMDGWNQVQTIFYVDQNHPDANDANPGTADLPWLTIQNAMNLAAPGDSVVIRQGIYQESLYTQNDGNVQDGHIIFAAQNNESVLIDGTGAIENTGINIGHSYLKFYGLEIYNWPITGIWMTEAAFVEAHHLEVHEVFYGIGIGVGSHDFLFSNTHVHHYTLYGFDVSPSGGGNCYNGTFINCSAHTGRDPEQNVDGFATGHGQQHNFVFDHCVTHGVYDGFDISSTSSTLISCLAYDCWNTGYKLWQDQIELINCIGYDGGISIVQMGSQDSIFETTFRNCTFSGAGSYTIWQANSNNLLNIYNCIISGGDNIGLSLSTAFENYHGDNNLFQNNNTARAINVGGIAEFSVEDIENGSWTSFSGQDANTVTASTLNDIYVNPTVSDYHLSPISPAIDEADACFAPNMDFDGNARPYGEEPDIGAYEFIGNIPIYLLTPTTIDFGTILSGQTSIQTLTITNPGEVPIIVDSIIVDSGVFHIPEINFPLEITDVYTLEISFEPTLQQSYEGILSIFSSQTYNSQVSISGTAIDEITGGYHISGNVSGLWQSYDSIFVDGDIVVPAGETLTVNPVPGGTDFIFTGHYKFIVYGQLELMGTQQDSISLYPTNKNEGWFGLRFYDINYTKTDSSRIQYCNFTYGNANGLDWDEDGGAIFIYESSPITIHDCCIRHNQATDGGGGMHIRYSNPDLKRLEFLNNSAQSGGAIQFQGAYPQMEYCLLANNQADFGGALFIYDSSPTFDHFTITENVASLGGASYQQDWSYPEFSNSIIWGNSGTEIHINPDGGSAAVNYCDVGGGAIYPGNGNINSKPLFADTNNGDFRLSWAHYPSEDSTKSPCINSGNPNYSHDPDGSLTEIGAKAFLVLGQTLEIPAGWSSLSSWVNPFTPELELLFQPSLQELIILKNMDGYFWPSQNSNTLQNWDSHSGYLIKMNEAVSLSVFGNTILQRSLALTSGWNLIPVPCSCELLCSEVLEQLGDNLVIIKEPASTLVFWPNWGIQTLQTLQPGNAYFILLIENTELRFPECPEE